MRSSFVLLLAVSVASSNIATAFSNLRTTQRNLQTYTQYSDYSQQMLDAVNTERAKAGLSALCSNRKLAAAAKRHSDDMARKNYMAHEGSDGSTLSQRITQAEYEWNAIAENVAAGQEDVTAVMKSWMDSDGHRMNILGADYTMLGTAYAYSASTTYKHYWTQDFGTSKTEVCDSSRSNSSQTVNQTQQPAWDDVVGETTKAPSSTMALGNLTTMAPRATATTSASAAEDPVLIDASAANGTPAVESPVATPLCKAKK